MSDLTPPVIVIPGITASVLRDHYPNEPETVWNVLPFSRSYERITLHPEDTRYEAIEPARVLPDRMFMLPYDDLVNELRHNLSERADEPVPVYPFAYDWRRPLIEIQSQLAAFIDEVISRTALLRHYFKARYTRDNGQVDLVGHSMGGLLIAGYLANTPTPRVRKVATLATPFRGSFEAVLKVATGTAAIGMGRQSSREREAARITPALYHLIPQWDSAVITDHFEWHDLFDVETWQPSVVETIAEHIRIVGRDPGLSDARRLTMAKETLGAMLEQARAHRETVDKFTLAQAGLVPTDWLCIVGLGEKTRTELIIKSRQDVQPDAADEPFFDLDGDQRKNGYPAGNKDAKGAQPVETGDGTVPYFGAKPTFLTTNNLVGVCDSDFGYWEARDRLAEAAAGLHGLMPGMNLVQRLVVAHLRGKDHAPGVGRPGLWGRLPPDLVGNWEPAISGLAVKG
jgi:pimeloyl-ACP methyl ester carboxylesterase